LYDFKKIILGVIADSHLIFYIFEKKDILKILKREETRRYIRLQKLKHFVNYELQIMKNAFDKLSEI